MEYKDTIKKDNPTFNKRGDIAFSQQFLHYEM